MLVALLLSTYVIPRFTPAVIAVVAIVLLCFGTYNHYTSFPAEYNVMQWATTGQQIAPTLITGLVIVLMGGYIIYMFTTKGGMPNLPSMSANSPPPNTATNPLTQAIGAGLANMGATNINRNYAQMNTAHRNEAESMLARAQ